MSSSLFLIILLITLPAASCIGCLLLLQSVAKNSKKHQLFIRKLKKQGKYEEWVSQHKYSVLAEKVYQYKRSSIIMLVLIGFLITLPSVPNNIVIILEIVGYVYWPLAFLVIFTIYNLYKKGTDLSELNK
jgi:hypothetical protein